MKVDNIGSVHNLILKKITENLRGDFENFGDIETFDSHEDAGLFTIRTVKLQSGIHIIRIQGSFVETTNLNIDDVLSESLQFYYCHEGKFYQHFREQSLTHNLDQFQTAIAHSIVGYNSEISIPKETEVDIHITYVDRNTFFDKYDKVNNYFGVNLLQLLSSINYSQQYIHLGNLNLKIAAQLRLISYEDCKNKISQSLLNKGRYYIILATQIAQFYNEVSDTKNTSGLLKKELQEITSLSETIKDKPEKQYSLRKLCIESGLSPAKLQEGFKFMFERTVSDFIKTTRLEKAEYLIRTTDLSISEIVYSIGLTSRSYFCKIFKNKYHYSPKEYRKKST